ncbi:transcription termination factor Rho [Streptomyces sulfonofaciens]|uniref:Transcription termination factor Rho n=1 Tax=Streptomyces sulfonofaciens TaxID=68272 RepID=A0A919GEX3_9ACTN|nr:transcription termination factor Rho [Streptomyces sulfonofaciens]GHH83342.1 transcription termination factor Rho [Streptomyces sulfonofaciens]
MTTTLERPTPPPDAERPERTSGVLDITTNGNGLLRGHHCLPTPDDVQVSAAQIRRLGLRKGDTLVCDLDGPHALGTIALVNGRPPADLHTRPHFRDLTPLHPRDRLRLEHPGGGLAERVVDLLAPIGKGQRGLIVAPPRTGKTVLLQQVAGAVAANHPECHLMVVLLDERPEEVTDMRRRVHGEVLASTFDRSAKEHIALAELAVARAQRMVEQGRDVVILLDSLTRLCRAHNNAAAAGGRTLSGGVDAGALHGPKRLFGAARLTEEAGSLTILATALVETGSRADEYFFEELKSTGNMELRLDRAQADKRLFPAVDIPSSGTRREELLLPARDLTALHGLRRALRRSEGHTGLDTLLQRMRRTPDNAAFLRQIHRTVPAV